MTPPAAPFGELDELYEKATKGPWKITSCLDVWIEHENPLVNDDREFNGIAHCGDIAWPNWQEHETEWKANAALIVALVNAYPALKAAHAAARNDALEEAAAFQEVRAQLRHGYDKYEDAAAIRALKAAR